MPPWTHRQGRRPTDDPNVARTAGRQAHEPDRIGLVRGLRPACAGGGGLLGPAGSSPEVLQMFGLLQPVFKPLGLEVETLELTGRGGWRATLDSDAVVELGGGTPQEVVQRTQRFTRTLTQVAAQYGRRVDALESADLRHAGGYALRMRGVTT